MRDRAPRRAVAVAALCTLVAWGCASPGKPSAPADGAAPAAPRANAAAAAAPAASSAAPTPAGAPQRPAISGSQRPISDAPPALATARAAYAKGLAWILANQRPDGSFGTFESPRAREIYLDTQASHRAFHTATTALVCWSLLAPAHANPAAAAALDRGLAWLEDQGEIGRASGKTFYSVWTHTYLMELAAAVLRDPGLAAHHAAWRAIGEREAAVARREQSAEGGWAYYDFNHVGQNPSGNESTSFNTGAMIEALANARAQGIPVPDGTIADAATCIRRMRVPSGAYAYGTYAELNLRAEYNKVDGSSGRLQACNIGLLRAGDKDVTPEVLVRGVELLRETHHYIEIARGRVMPHEAYYRCSGYYYFFGHYYCARVLQESPAGARRDAMVRWLADQMVADQNKDGSWFDYPLYGYGFAYATGFAMRTLELAIPMLEQQVAAPNAGTPAPAAAPTASPSAASASQR